MLFWRFLDPGGSLESEFAGSYNFFLVAISFLVASTAGFSALEIVDRMGAASTTRTRRMWLVLGAMAMGSGIWAMHFVGMMAFSLPIPVAYDLRITVLSMLPALFASLIVLSSLNRSNMHFIQLNISGLFMAVGIGGMHYTGMEAMRMEGGMGYDPGLFALSIVVAHVLATFALYIKFFVAAKGIFTRPIRKLVSAVGMGMAVACMHYTAMGAAKFYPGGDMMRPENVIEPLSMSLSIAAITSFIMSLAIIATVIDRRMEALNDSLMDSQKLFQNAIDTAYDAFITTDSTGTITTWNQAAERIFGWPANEAIGRRIDETIIPEDHREAYSLGLTRYLQTGEGTLIGTPIELSALHIDGREFPLEITLSAVEIEGESSFLSISRDISERKEHESKLEEAKVQAEAAAVAKSEFLANMSHEIRTPMNGVIGMTSLLLDSELSEKQRRFTQTISNSADALLTVINDILDFSKIEAGKLDLDFVDFDLRVAVEDMLDAFALRTAEKGVELACLIAPDVPSFVNGDPGRIHQILNNLISNAVKFTEEGEVVVKATLLEQDNAVCKILFEVEDTGIGITKEQLELLFQPFTQADASTTRKYGGTGLGLTIAKQLAELMGGEIGAESVKDKGSTFWFTITIDVLPEQSKPKMIANPDVQDKRILIVDDNATNRLVLEEHLKSWGCTDFNQVPGGAEALEAMHEAAKSGNPYEIALLDMMMPEMDGEMLGKHIKEDPVLASTYMIMLSSMGQHGDVARLKESGFEAYLSKPIKQSELYDCLITVLSSIPGREDTVVSTSNAKPLSVRVKGDKPRILLAEDNEVNQMVAVNMLEKFGFEIDVVDDGRQALNAMENTSYDLVFMDVQMPAMDGFEATAGIRSTEEESGDHVYIIAMTAHAMKGDQERCMEAGMDDYVSKPIQKDKLKEALARGLADTPFEVVDVRESGADTLG